MSCGSITTDVSCTYGNVLRVLQIGIKSEINTINNKIGARVVVSSAKDTGPWVYTVQERFAPGKGSGIATT